MKRVVIERMDDTMVAIMRSKSPAEKLAMLDGMWTSARDMIHRVIRHEHPEWSTEEVHSEFLRRLGHGHQ